MYVCLVNDYANDFLNESVNEYGGCAIENAQDFDARESERSVVHAQGGLGG